jgi:hypothetical protein
MDCLVTLAANAICLIAPSQLALRADISTQASGNFHYTWAGKDYGGARVGRVEVDMPLVIYRTVTVSAFALHQSMVSTGRDRGEERVGLQLILRPFGGGR